MKNFLLSIKNADLTIMVIVMAALFPIALPAFSGQKQKVAQIKATKEFKKDAMLIASISNPTSEKIVNVIGRNGGAAVVGTKAIAKSVKGVIVSPGANNNSYSLYEYAGGKTMVYSHSPSSTTITPVKDMSLKGFSLWWAIIVGGAAALLLLLFLLANLLNHFIWKETTLNPAT